MKRLILVLTILTIATWAGPVAAYEAGGVDIHGFITQGFLYSDTYNYLADDTKDGSFEYNEVGLNFGKPLTDKLRVGVQFFSRDLGDAANNKVTIDWAYGDYRFKDWLGLRAGKIRTPFGLYSEIHDMDVLRTCIVMPQGVYTDLLRDAAIAMNGVSLYGQVPAGAAGGFDYQLLTGKVPLDNDSGISKSINNSLSSISPVEMVVDGAVSGDTAYAGRFFWETPLPGLRLGYSIYKLDIEIPILVGGLLETVCEMDLLYQIYSAEYVWNNLTVAAEYVTTDHDLQMLGLKSSRAAEAYYLSATYQFVDWFTLGAYYAEYYPDRDDKSGDNQSLVDHRAWEKDLALTLRFDINEYWVFKIEGHAVDGTANVLGIDNDGNDFSSGKWYYGAAKLSFNF